MAIIKRNQKSRLQEVNEKEINPNEKIKSTELVDENKFKEESKIMSSGKKTIGNGGKISNPPVVEDSEIEDDLEEVMPLSSSKKKVIGKGGRISKSPVVDKSEVSPAYSDLENIEDDEEETESLGDIIDKLHKNSLEEESEDTENNFEDDEIEPDIDDISEMDTEDSDEISEEDEIILKASKKKKSQFVLNREQFSEKDITYVNGIPVAPIDIESYETLTITENEANIIKKLGINSIIIDDGDTIPVKVFGTKKSFAMLIRSDIGYFLKWISDFIKLENKSKSTNGKVYVDLIAADELSSKKIAVPVSTLTDKYKIKTLSNYDIYVSPTDSMTIAVALKKVLEKMPIQTDFVNRT